MSNVQRVAPVLVVLLVAASRVSAQPSTMPRLARSFAKEQSTKPPVPKAPVRRRAPAPVKPIQAAADITCPSPLGTGVKTKFNFCDVLTGRDPAQGIIIKFPPHRGVLTFRFDLHNRHTYSDDDMRSGRGFASYTASIGVLTLDNTLLTRAVVIGEFRREEDLIDRITGGAGPGGVKAVAPVGSESIVLSIPADVDQVSILGEKLTMVRADGVPAVYAAPGRPVAVISNVTVEYTPAPAPPPRRAK
jgi:hypothetical protein